MSAPSRSDAGADAGDQTSLDPVGDEGPVMIGSSIRALACAIVALAWTIPSAHARPVASLSADSQQSTASNSGPSPGPGSSGGPGGSGSSTSEPSAGGSGVPGGPDGGSLPSATGYAPAPP